MSHGWKHPFNNRIGHNWKHMHIVFNTSTHQGYGLIQVSGVKLQVG